MARAREADEVMRDLIVDRRSFGSLARERFDTAEQERLARHANKLSKMLLKHIDANIRPLSNDTYRIELGKRLKVELPRQASESYQITFNYHQALIDDLIDYGSFGHPLFDALIDYCTGPAFAQGLTTRRTIVDEEHSGFEGFQFNFLVIIRSVQERREVVPIAVDCEGRYRPELRDLLLDSFDWQNAPEPFEPERYTDWSTLVERARDAAEAALDAGLSRRVAEIRAGRQGDYETERRKIEQYCAYRETQAERKIEHSRGVVLRLNLSRDDEERRILPVWQRKLETDLADLEALHRERVRLEQELQQRLHVSYSTELLSAAWVKIVAPVTDKTALTDDNEEMATGIPARIAF